MFFIDIEGRGAGFYPLLKVNLKGRYLYTLVVGVVCGMRGRFGTTPESMSWGDDSFYLDLRQAGRQEETKWGVETVLCTLPLVPRLFNKGTLHA